MKKIIIDENDNQIDIWEIFHKQIWKKVYIPKDLRKAYKISYNEKQILSLLKRKRNENNIKNWQPRSGYRSRLY